MSKKQDYYYAFKNQSNQEWFEDFCGFRYLDVRKTMCNNGLISAIEIKPPHSLYDELKGIFKHVSDEGKKFFVYDLNDAIVPFQVYLNRISQILNKSKTLIPLTETLINYPISYFSGNLIYTLIEKLKPVKDELNNKEYKKLIDILKRFRTTNEADPSTGTGSLNQYCSIR